MLATAQVIRRLMPSVGCSPKPLLVLVGASALLAACGQDAPAPSPALTAPSVSAPLPPSTATTAPPRAPDLVPQRARTAGHEVLAFRVELPRARVTIVDVTMSAALEAALLRTGGSLAVNGGFFTPDTQPEGLAVSEGRELSAKSLALGGGVLTVARGRGQMFAVEDYAAPEGLDFAVQCRPRLVVGGVQHIKKDDGREAERTALCLRDGGATLEVVLARSAAPGRGPTLSAWSELLTARGCESALNLDGGPSTGAAWREGGAIQAAPPRAGVRHAIVVSME